MHHLSLGLQATSRRVTTGRVRTNVQGGPRELLRRAPGAGDRPRRTRTVPGDAGGPAIRSMWARIAASASSAPPAAPCPHDRPRGRSGAFGRLASACARPGGRAPEPRIATGGPSTASRHAPHSTSGSWSTPGAGAASVMAAAARGPAGGLGRHRRVGGRARPDSGRSATRSGTRSVTPYPTAG